MKYLESVGGFVPLSDYEAHQEFLKSEQSEARALAAQKAELKWKLEQDRIENDALVAKEMILACRKLYDGIGLRR